MAELDPAAGHQRTEQHPSHVEELPPSVAKRHEQMRVLEETAESLAQGEVETTAFHGGADALRLAAGARAVRHVAGRPAGMMGPSESVLKSGTSGGPITPLMVGASIHKMMNIIGARMVDLMESAIDPEHRKDVRTELLLLLRLRGILGRQLNDLPNDVVLCEMVLAFVQQIQRSLTDLQQGGVGRLRVFAAYLRELVNELSLTEVLEKNAQTAFKTRLRELNAQLADNNVDVEALTSQILGVAELTQALWEKHCLVVSGSWLEDAVRHR